MNLKKHQLYFLSVFSGIILSLAWTEWGLGLAMFVGFVPLLFVEDYLDRNRHKFRSVKAFTYSYVAFLSWNVISTWWIYYASFYGALMAIVFNSLFMASVFWVFHITKRKLGERLGYLAFVFFWIAFEYLHLNWELSWTWLTIGNGFSRNISLIQWYEYTGVFGGTLWVLIINVLIFSVLRKYINNQSFEGQNKNLIFLAILIFVPIALSLVRFYTYEEKIDSRNVVVVQPNIDPYNEKFGGLTPNDQLLKLLVLADSLTNDSIDYVVGPETALVKGIWEDDIEHESATQIIRGFVDKHPNVKFIVGLTSYKLYGENEEIPPTARKYHSINRYYDVFNSSLQIDTSENIQLYHKSQLVLGVEKLPFPKTLSFVKDMAIDLGGTVGSLGSQKERTNFKSLNDSTQIATAICYESIYGEFITKHVKNGANLIFVITNDGWWEDTPGYKQHLSFSRLRAVENRRSIARSANTGISCFINQKGEIIKPTSWWTPDVLSGSINSNTKFTFYTLYGDYIGRIASFISVLILIFTTSIFFLKGK